MPVLAVVLLAFTWGRDLPGAVVALVTLVLAGAVLAAVHHAEVVAHRAGEPFGSLVLAVAVTIFVATQTVRHRDYFLPLTRQGEVILRTTMPMCPQPAPP
ncbi:putative Ionic transporter integral membrane protein [Streptomyces viridochromogenes Tue57]|uniref:Putative Ionic transporter integral membrane protein n=1 Tax=Streptomyces viridochromogenes Tue57 TaxID=1160705 RepID=L8P8A7_STRVR|nr:putative Ionic transporter integral membrane protein [Streptomyces viridochromogenes Tue57]